MKIAAGAGGGVLACLAWSWLVGVWLAGASVAEGLPARAACLPPPSPRAPLHGKPSAESYANLGDWFAGQKQFLCAADAFAQAAGLEPASAGLDYKWGLSLYLAGQARPAAARLLAAERLAPGDAKTHLALAAALDGLQQRRAAEKEWRAALAIDADSGANSAADDADALDGLSTDLLADQDNGAVIALLDQPTLGTQRAERTPRQSLNLGLAYARRLQLEQASRVLGDGLATTPDSLPLAQELATVLILRDRTEEAEQVLSAALERHPGDFDTQVLYLRVLITAESDQALALAEKLLRMAPRNPEVLDLNARLEMGAGHFVEARGHLERSVSLEPGKLESQQALGGVLSKLGEFSAAREHLEKAIALGDRAPAVQYELARVLQGLGLSEQAKQRMQIYLQMTKAESNRSLAASKMESADRAMAAGDAAQAVAFYREALADDPGEGLVAYKLAKALDKTGDFAGERAALGQAIALNPDLAEAENQMGYLDAKDNDDAQAEICFRAALRASPSYLPAWINLAATLAAEARWREAQQALAQALEIDPNNAQAERLRQAIAAAEANP